MFVVVPAILALGMVTAGISFILPTPALSDPAKVNDFLATQSSAFVGCKVSEIAVTDAKVNAAGNPKKFLGSWALTCRNTEHACSRVVTAHSVGQVWGTSYATLCRPIGLNIQPGNMAAPQVQRGFPL